jgi:hypothetical protein
MYTVEAGKQVKIWVSVKINIPFSRPFPKNQITHQPIRRDWFYSLCQLSERNEVII